MHHTVDEICSFKPFSDDSKWIISFHILVKMVSLYSSVLPIAPGEIIVKYTISSFFFFFVLMLLVFQSQESEQGAFYIIPANC